MPPAAPACAGNGGRVPNLMRPGNRARRYAMLDAFKTNGASPPPLHPVKDLAALRLVLLLGDEVLVAQGLEFTQLVGDRARGCARASRSGTSGVGNVPGVPAPSEIPAAVSLVPALSQIRDDDRGPGRVERGLEPTEKLEILRVAGAGAPATRHLE